MNRGVWVGCRLNCVIYLPVVVKSATRVFAFLAGRDTGGGGGGTQKTRHIHPMLQQCCVSVADSGPTLYHDSLSNAA